jgi:hypothetical protein
MKLTPFIILGALVSAYADFSPLDVNQNGIGTMTSPLGARERGMGNSGLASVPQPGVSQANPSRMAFQDKHSFSATLETSLEYLHDDNTGNRRSDAYLPGLTLAFPMRSYGALGFWYWQTAHRNFNFEPEVSLLGITQSYRAEGGLFELGAAYSLAPIPQFAVGIDIRKILGQERFIQTATFDKNISGLEQSQQFDRINADSLTGDTLQRSLDGIRGGLSATLRQKYWNLALAIQSGTHVDTKTTRRITNMSTGIRNTSELYLPWSGTLALALKPKPGHTVTLDGTYSDWDQAQGKGLNPGLGLNGGYEMQGLGGGYDSYWKRMAWRTGAGYESLYIESSWQTFATVGLGLPLGSHGHVVDISLLGGHRELGGTSFLAEDYLKMTVTIQGIGNWGQPARRRR